MSDDPNSIPLVESNKSQSPSITPRKKRKSTKTRELLKVLVFVVLVILVLVLIAALVISLFRKCDSSFPQEKKPERKIKLVRTNNSYWNNIELPDTLNPKRYSLTLQLLKEAFNLSQHDSADYFFGRVSINFTMLSRSSFIVLHSWNLTIRSISIKHIEKPLSKKQIVVKERIYDPFYHQLILVFSEPLLKSKGYTLDILYSGNITLSKSGIIRTFYRNLKFNKIYDIIYSKLEPIGARRMFPCFDEPHKKALFTVNIIHNTKYTPLSNMELIKSTQIGPEGLVVNDNDLVPNSTVTLSTFHSTTIPMSTYLVAFVLVENYNVITQERKLGHNVSVWGPEGFQESGLVSLKYATSSETLLETYLNFDSPMKKTDHIYIPNFLSGAMENWGLITYRENHLLMRPHQGEYFYKKAYMTIAHELAHIWFGNWVTMKSWTDLWLNEGFATYFASYAYFQQLQLTSMEKSDLFLYFQRQILDKDGKAASFPVRQQVVNFKNIFSSYTYSKGQALLIWLESIMGQEKFRSGIQKYVRQYATKSPTTEQFFDIMQQSGFENNNFKPLLKDFFSPWLNRIGYPILTVNYDIGNKQILISQMSVVENSTKNSTWPVYTVYKTEQKPLEQSIYFRDQRFLINETLGESEFALVNSEGKSYVRVNYSIYLWTQIIDNIKSGNRHITGMNRIVLFDDNLYLADNGLIDISITKSLIDTLVNETNIVPWSIFYHKIFMKTYDLLKDDAMFFKWTNYVKTLSKKILETALKINSFGDLTIDIELFQRQIFFLNCEIDNSEVLDFMSERFLIWIKNPKTENLPRHLVKAILYYGIKINDKRDLWMKMWNTMTGEDQPMFVTKDDIAFGLTGTSRPYLLNKLLDYVLTPHSHSSDISKYQFVNNLISRILQSSNGINILTKWILNDYVRIKKFAFGDNVPWDSAQTNLEVVIGQMASSTCDLNVIKPLLKLHRKDVAIKKIINANIKWRENIGKRLLQML